MATFIKNELKIKHDFDPQTKRHYNNGILSVLHCHHYSTLYTQLALDANETELLKESAWESFREMLIGYFEDNNVTSLINRADIACQYYAAIGLGKMQIININEHSGEVELLSSHNDEGWKKKWGKYDGPINYISAGYIEAMFEAILDQPQKSFLAKETQSIVMGSETSKFKVTRR
jgi:hypothetical protein